MNRISVTIDGMSCGHCVAAVSRALGALGGVEVEKVDIGAASLAFDPALTSTDAITQAIEDEGYAVLSTEPAPAS
jgi:copper chaperone CopZ